MNIDLRLDLDCFDPHFAKSIYPGITAVQLEPGPVMGSLRSITADWLRISSGWLSRSVLYEGAYAEDTLNVGFILTSASSAVAHGRRFDDGIISIDLRGSRVHEVFPSRVAWVEVSGPISLMVRHIKSAKRMIRSREQCTLNGPRSQLAPLIDLVQDSLWRSGNGNSTSRSALQSRSLEGIERVLAARTRDAVDPQPFMEGDRFRTRVLHAGHECVSDLTRPPPSLEDLCRATGMKRRTLQKYWRETYGMGPTKYARTRRLDAVRAALMESSCTNTQVSEVAGKCGFTHMGRFAMYYRRLFAETPSQTLQRGVRQPDVG